MSEHILVPFFVLVTVGWLAWVIFMRVLSVVYAALSAVWFLHYLWRAGFVELLSGWNVSGDEACFAAAIGVLSIVILAGYLLWDSRRSGERVPST
jgi:hypothetical protein